MEDLGNFRLGWPRTYADQSRLVRIVEELDAAHARVEHVLLSQLSLLAERRQALITAAVTGQMDVTTARRG